MGRPRSFSHTRHHTLLSKIVFCFLVHNHFLVLWPSPYLSHYNQTPRPPSFEDCCCLRSTISCLAKSDETKIGNSITKNISFPASSGPSLLVTPVHHPPLSIHSSLTFTLCFYHWLTQYLHSHTLQRLHSLLLLTILWLLPRPSLLVARSFLVIRQFPRKTPAAKKSNSNFLAILRSTRT